MHGSEWYMNTSTEDVLFTKVYTTSSPIIALRSQDFNYPHEQIQANIYFLSWESHLLSLALVFRALFFSLILNIHAK